MQRMTIAVSDDLADKLESVAAENEQTKNEILRKALTLFMFAHDERKKGNKIGVTGPDGHLDTEVVGI